MLDRQLSPFISYASRTLPRKRPLDGMLNAVPRAMWGLFRLIGHSAGVAPASKIRPPRWSFTCARTEHIAQRNALEVRGTHRAALPCHAFGFGTQHGR